jgi:hypothetical protein
LWPPLSSPSIGRCRWRSTTSTVRPWLGRRRHRQSRRAGVAGPPGRSRRARASSRDRRRARTVSRRVGVHLRDEPGGRAPARPDRPRRSARPDRGRVRSRRMCPHRRDRRGRVLVPAGTGNNRPDRGRHHGCRNASITIEALRFTNGETRMGEQPVSIRDVTDAAGGTIEDIHVDHASSPGEQPRHSWRYGA